MKIKSRFKPYSPDQQYLFPQDISRSRFGTQGGHKLIFAILAMNSPHNQTI